MALAPPPAAPVRASWVLVVVAVVAIGGALLLDRTAWDRLLDAKIYERDWGRLLRVMGYLPVWLLLAVVVAQHGGAWRRAGLALAIAPLLGGALAEGLKLLFRRERPPAELYGEYVFRPFTVDPWSTRGLGLPSSHTLVAMAAATVLAHCFPRGRWLWYGLAVGCGLTRVAARAHYLSDVAVALVVGGAVGALVWRRVMGNATRADAR